eukprot:905270-Pleurochrysis_carterae.AAC.1
MQGYRGSRNNLKIHTRTEQNARRRNKNGMRNLTNVSEMTAPGTAKMRQYSTVPDHVPRRAAGD